MKKDIPLSENQTRTKVAILISDKIDFKSKMETRDKESHYIMIKGSILQEDIIFGNIHMHSTPEHLNIFSKY